jgi:type IV pilus assembly protein PilE
MQAHKTSGFTLIELMIVVAILAITALYAYSSYTQYGFRARRAEGQQYITQIAAAEERHFTAVNSYTTSVTGAGGLGFSSTTSLPNGYYTVVVTLPATGTYLVTGTPTGSQANDKCGNLSLDSTGIKLPLAVTMPENSNGKCW